MDVREVIDKLQSIDAKDLQNIDWDNLRRQLVAKPEILIIISLIVLSILSSIYFSISSQKRTSAYKQEIMLMNEKLEAANENKTIKRQYDAFLEEFPEQVTVDQIVDVLSSYALEEGIKILSYSPAQTDDQKFLKVSSFSISIKADNFPKILSFLKTVENSPYALRVEKWQGRYFEENIVQSGRRSRNQQREEEAVEHKEGVMADLELSLIELKI